MSEILPNIFHENKLKTSKPKSYTYAYYVVHPCSLPTAQPACKELNCLSVRFVLAALSLTESNSPNSRVSPA